MSQPLSAAAYIKRMFGFNTRTVINPVTNTVGVTAVQIARNNPGRWDLWISNNSANAVYILNKNTVSSTNGFYLAPNGGNAILNVKDDLLKVTDEWFAIAAGAGSAITVEESIIY